MEEEAKLKIDNLYVKYQFLEMKDEEIEALYNDVVLYKQFLKDVKYFLTEEPGFFLNDESLLSFLLNFVNKRRFELKKEEVGSDTNNLILAVNKINGIGDKDVILKNYIHDELHTRFGDDAMYKALKFNYSTSFRQISSLVLKDFQVFDFVFYTLVEKEDFSKVIPMLSQMQFISSINYFRSYLPEIFTNNIKEKAIDVLDNISDRELKKYAIKTKKNLIRL